MIRKSSTRAVVNTGVQYIRSIISVCILLYTSRLILSALGVKDFGLYSLILGVVSMLSFIKDSLAQTIQRYLSYYQGIEDLEKQCKILNNSLLIQLLISVSLIVILFLLKDFVLYELLNIDAQRLEAASFVYSCMLVMLFFTMQSAPYFAVLIAHENIVYTSVIQIIDVFLKLFVALYLSSVNFDKLSFYALCMTSIPVFEYACYCLYCRFNYAECRKIKLLDFDLNLFRDMFSFMGWNIYSVGCITGRTQGIAILLNRYFGVVVNAAYGIAQQVTGQISFLSGSLLNAMQPQIVKAEGSKDRNKMFLLSETTSKFAFFLIGFVTVPTLFYMDEILTLWLGIVPDYASMACQYILLAAWMDQLTMGLGAANKAIGQIKKYSIIVNTIKIITIPTAWFCLRMGLSVESVFVSFVVFEILCAITRLFLLKSQGDMSISQFVQNVFLKEIVPIGCLFLSTWICYKLIPIKMFLLTYIISAIAFGIAVIICGLTSLEKQTLERIFKR